jgi:hypothetical protein
MSNSTKPRRPKKRKRTVAIGGTSQSAFAGYAPKTGKPQLKKKTASRTRKPDPDKK